MTEFYNRSCIKSRADSCQNIAEHITQAKANRRVQNVSRDHIHVKSPRNDRHKIRHVVFNHVDGNHCKCEDGNSFVRPREISPQQGKAALVGFCVVEDEGNDCEDSKRKNQRVRFFLSVEVKGIGKHKAQ